LRGELVAEEFIGVVLRVYLGLFFGALVEER
jgi:hypothetical protein